MKSLLLQLSTLILSLAMLVASEEDFIPREYLLELNIDLVKTAQDLEDVKEALGQHGVEVIRDLGIKDKIQLLQVRCPTEGQVRKAARELDEVEFYEKNGVIKLDKSRTWCQDISATETWGLDRIDQKHKLDSADPFNKAAMYKLSHYKGAGVVAYIGDTGIDVTHPQFEGRALNGFSIDTFDDDDGHGTHVAGTVGSRLHGVAKEITLVSVKVFSANQANSWANLIAGLRWIHDDHITRQSQAGGTMPRSVVNLSLSGGINLCAEATVNILIEAGISVVVSAGNNNRDACHFTPARVPNAVTVGATDVLDKPASFSNWGECVDIYGPGVNVTSTWPDHGTNVLHGTSMSAPHVTGVVALKMGREKRAMSPQDVSDWLLCLSTKDKLDLTGNHETSPNRLLYVTCRLKGCAW